MSDQVEAVVVETERCAYEHCRQPSFWAPIELREGGRAESPIGPMHFACYSRWMREQLGQRPLR